MSLFKAWHKSPSSLVHMYQSRWSFFFFLAYICVFQVCTWYVTVRGELSVKHFPSSLPIPHKKKSFESSIGVPVFSELRYSRVCFIMVLGPLQPEIWYPGENLHSAIIYQSPAGGKQNDTQASEIMAPPIIFRIDFKLMVCFLFSMKETSWVIIPRPLRFCRCCFYCDYLRKCFVSKKHAVALFNCISSVVL